jgi:hypothetical protein
MSRSRPTPEFMRQLKFRHFCACTGESIGCGQPGYIASDHNELSRDSSAHTPATNKVPLDDLLDGRRLDSKIVLVFPSKVSILINERRHHVLRNTV